MVNGRCTIPGRFRVMRAANASPQLCVYGRHPLRMYTIWENSPSGRIPPFIAVPAGYGSSAIVHLPSNHPRRILHSNPQASGIRRPRSVSSKQPVSEFPNSAARMSQLLQATTRCKERRACRSPSGRATDESKIWTACPVSCWTLFWWRRREELATARAVRSLTTFL
ncbi:hypothetical protein BD311DRAFT_762349 [Dichomitus squalens]|uniref:Uncharacterized protein n=1 Tax=Dichomitus squalens TaxID=114155 RepID=A0A4Q9MGS3_9APHY|nr:hypothetical protein BD311DRAFT_762349 [Dichomitus squalens]